MPAPGGGNTRAKQLRRKRREPVRKPSTSGPSDARGGGGYTPGPRRATPRPSGAFGPLRPATAPLTDAARRAGSRSRRAESRIPERAVPHVPILRNPTPAQVLGAKRIIAGTVNRAAGRGASGRDTQSRRDAILRELSRSKSGQRLLEAGRHYAAKENELLAAAGVPQRSARDRVSPGRAHTRASVPFFPQASVDLTSLGRGIMGATSLGGASPENSLVKAGLGDVKALGEGAFVGAYELGAGAFEASPVRRALGGADPSTARLERLGRGAWEGMKQSVPGRLLSGDVAGAGKSFREHPLFALLDLSAAGAVAGRGAGALARGAGSTTDAAGVRGALARAGSTARSPIALTEDAGAVRQGAYVERRGSKDLLRKGLQSLQDATREPLRDVDGKVVTVKQGRRDVPVLKPHGSIERERLNRREADFLAGRANSAERLARAEEAKQTQVGGVGRGRVRGKTGQALVSMVTEGTIRTGKTFDRDVEAQLKRLEGEYERRTKDPENLGYRHSAEASANRDKVKMLRRVVDARRHGKLSQKQVDRIAEVGIARGGHLNANEVRALDAKVLSSEPRAHRRRLMPAAISHHGGRHFSREEHARLEREAIAKEEAIKDRLVGIQPDGSHTRTPDVTQRAGLQRELAAARAERIAVSGREPHRVVAHEKARDVHAAAKLAHERALGKVKQLHDKRQRLIGAQTSRRGRRGKEEGKTRAATKAERKKLEALDREYRAAKAEAKRLRGERAKANQRLVQTPMPEINEGIRKPGGHFLSNKEIEDALRAEGRDPGTVAYLPHRMDVRGRRAFHQQFRPGTRPLLDKPERSTGEAYRKGATESSAALIQEHGVRQVTILAKADQLDRLVERAARHPAWAKAQRGEELTAHERRVVNRGGYFTPKEAQEVTQRLEHDDEGRVVLFGKGGERLYPMRGYSSRLDSEAQTIIREGLQGPGAMESLPQRLLNDRFLRESEFVDNGARNVVLVPAGQVEQLERHLRPAGEVEKFFQALNRPFRFAVLAQPRWLTGNFVEPFVVRLTTSGSGLNVFGLGADITAATRVLRRMERSGSPKTRAAAREIRAQHLGGLFVGGRGATVRRTADETAVGAFLRDLPVVGQGFDILRAAGRALMAPGNAYFRVNRAIENVAQRAALGHDIRRDLQEFTGSWMETMRLHKASLDEVAQGLVNTPTQRRMLRSQHELLGKYDSWAPWMRRLTQSIMPFLPWALNAARFVFWTMPAHRTIQTALLQKVNETVARDWEEIHKGVPPGGLKLAIPTKAGGWIDLARYTPYGLTGPAAEGDYKGITGQFVPQLSGVQSALEGKDPFGRDLRVQPTQKNPGGVPSGGQKLLIALNSAIEAGTPYVATARRLQEHGGTAYGDSTVLHPKVKPQSLGHGMSAARRTFDPFRPTYLQNGGGVASSSSDELAPELDEIRSLSAPSSVDEEADMDEIRALLGG